MKTEKKFIVANHIENLNIINSYLEELLGKLNIPMKIIYKVLVTFEEIFVNICNYAYRKGTVGNIIVSIKTDNEQIKIQIEDEGIPYNPLNKEDPDITASVEDRPIGGLGIFMTKKMLDSFDYKYEDGKNINILIKSFAD